MARENETIECPTRFLMLLWWSTFPTCARELPCVGDSNLMVSLGVMEWCVLRSMSKSFDLDILS
jgi:hypothetical protein